MRPATLSPYLVEQERAGLKVTPEASPQPLMPARMQFIFLRRSP